MDKFKKKIKVRKAFRVLAGLISGLAIFSLFSSIQMICLGYWHHIAGSLIALIFMIESISIALRGDALLFYKLNRVCKNRKNTEQNWCTQSFFATRKNDE